MRNTIAVKTHIRWNGGKAYELSIELEGEDLNPESIIEEIRAMLSKWALTWLRQDCTISIRQKEAE